MEQIVGWAARRKLDVIPVISNFGHTEHFLKYPPLDRLAELRGGRQGRFSKTLQTVCPSLPATRRFFEAYWSEIAPLFPSPYFHVGYDEVWDIGYCPACRRRIRQGESPSDLFAKYLLQTHTFVTGRLGKRLLMWDDMFEWYPEVLPRLPRDILMCAWHYRGLMDQLATHFGYCRCLDTLAEYRRLGFDFLICPWEGRPRNIATLTRYAERWRPMGAWLTRWGVNRPAFFPNLAFAGRWWSQPRRTDPDPAYRRACEALFQVRDPRFLNALDTLGHLECMPAPGRLQDLLRGPMTPYEYERSRQTACLRELLGTQAGRVRSPRGRLALEDMLAGLARESIAFALRRVLDELYAHPASPGKAAEAARECTRILREAARYKAMRRLQWQRIRPGFRPDLYAPPCDALAGVIRDLRARLVRYRGLGPHLTVRYFMPDYFIAQWVRLSIRYGTGGWARIYEGVPKGNLSDLSQMPYFTLTHLLEKDRPPRCVRFESWGYGGIGLVFVEGRSGARRFVPERIVRRSGILRDPAHILVDDTRWAFLGEMDAAKSFHQAASARRRHVLELQLAPAAFS